VGANFPSANHCAECHHCAQLTRGTSMPRSGKKPTRTRSSTEGSSTKLKTAVTENARRRRERAGDRMVGRAELAIKSRSSTAARPPPPPPPSPPPHTPPPPPPLDVGCGRAREQQTGRRSSGPWPECEHKAQAMTRMTTDFVAQGRLERLTRHLGGRAAPKKSWRRHGQIDSGDH